jgi:surfactin synthase thioesterase subunit
MENLYELLEEAAHKVPTKGIVIVNNTVAMVNYKFLDCKLKTPLCSIVGREDEPTIRNNQHLWNNYFQKVSFHQLPGGHVLITKYHAELAKLIMNYIELHV